MAVCAAKWQFRGTLAARMAVCAAKWQFRGTLIARMAVCAAKILSPGRWHESLSIQLKIHLEHLAPFYGPLLGDSVEGEVNLASPLTSTLA